MNASDIQDSSGDLAYDDISHISQKISPKRYPYRFEIFSEREYLLPIAYDTGRLFKRKEFAIQRLIKKGK